MSTLDIRPGSTQPDLGPARAPSPTLELRNAPAFDPAPSRWSYRYQRMMLTPGIRALVRYGLPICLMLAAGGVYFADETRRAQVFDAAREVRDSLAMRPEFMVNLMAVDGASRDVALAVREAVPLDFPMSSFDLDLAAIRDVVRDLDAVAQASVRIRPGGVLQIDVTERVPAFVWRTSTGLHILDETGVEVAQADQRAAYPELPLIAGEGAEKAVQEAAALFHAAAPLGARLRGLVRVGERRWDVVLTRDQRILLPEAKPVQALERVIVLNEAEDLLERDLSVVDLRLSQRPTLRMTEHSAEALRQIRENSGTGRGQ